jgi:undecaprenyl diphosphate synthase
VLGLRKKTEKDNLSLPKGTKVPDHIAMILDGNRRWARCRGLAPWEGHKAGYEAIKKVAKAARQMGVHTFTIWAFSTENWSRPKEEIDAILDLLRRGLKEFLKEAKRDKIRLVHLGRKDRFPKDVAELIAKVEAETAHFDKNILNLALDYGGRDEILRAVKAIVSDGVPAEKIDEELFASYLDTKNQPYPYPDLFIRTSGEQRTSGYLPWQMVYAEYYFEREHLPDFTPEKLRDAVLDYSRRRRRFGGNDKEKHFDFKPEVVARLELSWWRLSKVPEGVRFRDFVINYIKEQYGISKVLAKEAGKYLIEALISGDKHQWEKAKKPLKKFYLLLKKNLKLAFEPDIVTSLHLRKWQTVNSSYDPTSAIEAKDIVKNLLAEEYRISEYQFEKAAHLRVLAEVERNKALAGQGDHHWDLAFNYLEKYYKALKERIA